MQKEIRLNLVLTENGAVLVPGDPSIYVEDANFARLLQDKDFAKSMYAFFNDRVCVGRLGEIAEDGVYEERIFEYNTPDEEVPGKGLGYYAKL